MTGITEETISPSEEPTSEQALSTALELVSRCSSAGSYDEVCFTLTNDLRVLASFDGCFLITHMDAKSQLVSATHQPLLDGKSDLQRRILSLAPKIRKLTRPVVVRAEKPINLQDSSEGEIIAIDALISHMRESGAQFICCAPLSFRGFPVAHLIMEYGENNAPSKNAIMAIAKTAPTMASGLLAQWTLEKKPILAKGLKTDKGTVPQSGPSWMRRGILLALMVLGAMVILFGVPVTMTVGGEAELIHKEKEFAFCKIGGIIKQVYVRRGSEVEAKEVLAVLDSRDLDHRIAKEKRHYKILSHEIDLLKSRSFDDPSRLAKSELLHLKRKNIKEELDYLLWQSRFLEIRSPEAGLIITKDVETLKGKKLAPGEPFCEIARIGDLEAEVFVPEDRIMEVRPGHDLYVYLNNRPAEPYELKVDEIAVRSEVKSRLGNVYSVKGRFPDAPDSIKAGMKGIGKIHVGESTIWKILSMRLRARWNQLSVHFQ